MIWNPFSRRSKQSVSNDSSGSSLSESDNQVSGKIRPVVLVVLDGWGVAPPSEGNAITSAKTPNMNKFYSLYPHGELIASGESVGLPANEVGSSEVGHLTIGAGTVIYQSLKRVSVAIEDGTFFENKAFLQALTHVKKFNSKLHLMGLVSSGSVHSSMDHFYALLEFCKRNELTNVRLHLFTDGRDAPPKEGAEMIEEVEKKLETLRVGEIAVISGRYYAMDRDMRWARTQRAYEAIVQGKGILAQTASQAIENAYAKGQTDEFIEPTVIIKDSRPIGTVDDNDAVIFFNFRVDRPRQLTMAFVLPDFEKLKSFEIGDHPDHTTKVGEVVTSPTFKREKWPQNLFFVTMTEYQKKLAVSAVAFPPLVAKASLPLVLSEHGMKQLHLAESEKERMVTVYFDGLRYKRLPGEDVLIIPSPKVATYDKKPEMAVYKVVRELKKALSKNVYHFYVLNFANADMVAHSGNIKATLKAIEHVDKALGEVAEAVLASHGTLVITADHGNAEELLTFPTTSFFFTSSKGNVNTDHSNNPVPILFISNKLKGDSKTLPRGTLSDIAPTILPLMSLPVPPDMTGHNLFEATQGDKPVALSSDIPRPV